MGYRAVYRESLRYTEYGYMEYTSVYKESPRYMEHGYIVCKVYTIGTWDMEHIYR
jgi:hypothetical protein